MPSSQMKTYESRSRTYPLLPTEVSTIAILSAKANGAGKVTFDRHECKGVGTYPKTEAFNAGPQQTQGYASMQLPSGVTGYGVFRQTVAGREDQFRAHSRASLIGQQVVEPSIDGPRLDLIARLRDRGDERTTGRGEAG